MKNNIRTIISPLLAVCMMLAATPGLAQEAADPIGFSARAVLPQNQRDTTGYFDILIEPGEKQVLSIEVQNYMDVPLRVRVDLVDAYSNENGLIVYIAQGERKPPDEAFSKMAVLQHDLLPVGEREVVQKREENVLTIAPRATVLVPFEIALPNVPLMGQVLGGVVATKLPDDEHDTETESFEILSVYSYAVAVQLQTEDPVKTEPLFSAVSASLASVAGWDALRVTLQNEAPLVATGAQMELLVLDNEGKEVFAHTAERVSFAPKSEMPYTVLFGKDTPLPGTYQVKIALTYEGTVWNMTLPLDIPQAR